MLPAVLRRAVAVRCVSARAVRGWCLVRRASAAGASAPNGGGACSTTTLSTSSCVLATNGCSSGPSALISSMRCCASNASNGEAPLDIKYPIIQLPSRSLMTRQRPLPQKEVSRGDFDEMIERVKASRSYYQYPSLSAPQIGWNVQMFCLFDGTVWINPEVLETNCPPPPPSGDEATAAATTATATTDGGSSEVKNCWAWEPCASCAFLMHYIERPATVRIRALNERGEVVDTVLTGMRARLALHEMDHMDGIMFTRRIPDTNHVVLADGFSTMSDWSDDYPSLEARSTFLYTTYTPPFTFAADAVWDSNLLDRKFEDNIYPGHEMDKQLRIINAANDEIQKMKWRLMKEAAATGGATTNSDDDETVASAADEAAATDDATKGV